MLINCIEKAASIEYRQHRSGRWQEKEMVLADGGVRFLRKTASMDAVSPWIARAGRWSAELRGVNHVLPLYTWLGMLLSVSLNSAEVAQHLAELRRNPNRAAWDRVVADGPAALMPILDAWPADDPVVANWLRTAFEQIVRQHPKQLPIAALTQWVQDPTRLGKARRVALAALEVAQPGTTDRLLADWLSDPEFSFDAVERVIRLAEQLPPDQKVPALRRAFAACTAYEQVLSLAQQLQQLGDKPDAFQHLGIVTRWHLIGPFPVSPEEGLHQAFPPEQKIDLTAQYPGKTRVLRWTAALAQAPEGRIDLMKFGILPEDGAVAYAVAQIQRPQAGPVELRFAAIDNITAWVNGKKVVERSSDYRSLYRTDRYRAVVDLPAGPTTILLKLTKTRPDDNQRPAPTPGQPPATTPGSPSATPPGQRPTVNPGQRPGGPPPRWDFQVRIIDATGRGVPFTQQEPAR